MRALMASLLFLPYIVSSQGAIPCARGWVSRERINLKTKVSCSKLEKVEIPETDNLNLNTTRSSMDVFEHCQASCLADNKCIGLQTDKPWESCNKVTNPNP